MKKEYTPLTSRALLIEQLPLATPFSIHVCPATFCNFKCFYCTMSKHDRGGVLSDTNIKFMDMGFYKLLIEQMKEFPNKLKLLNFAWLGEPLLHPDIVEMVRIAKQADIAERVEIVSNGSMLNYELSKGLVEAGLDRIRISLQGLTEEAYWEASQYRIDLDKFNENIRVLHKLSKEHGSKTKIYIKIMDAMLKSEEDEALFKERYEDICDFINIETLIPLVEDIDISGVKQNINTGFWGNEIREISCCPEPFYTLVVSPAGMVMPCCEMGDKLNLGIISETNSIVDIWNGEKMLRVRRMMIEEGRGVHPVCRECRQVKYQIADEDILDSHIDRLKEMYK
ncbi:MAG: radical SAM protein [Lachnospiraceae bacterium]|nr:radical SAM protein [Lachnospiraceae bacterium]